MTLARTLLWFHLLGMSVWIGGTITVGAIVPALRRSGASREQLRAMARAFGRASWAALGVLVITGIWQMILLEDGAISDVTFAVKLLLVGIAGLGVVMIRSVRERRRDIGVMRAMGLEERPVTGAFMFEALFVATEGVMIGVLVALVGTYGLVLNGTGFMAGFEWQVPWQEIGVIALITLVAAALTAALPARAAGHTRPARALRVVD